MGRELHERPEEVRDYGQKRPHNSLGYRPSCRDLRSPPHCHNHRHHHRGAGQGQTRQNRRSILDFGCTSSKKRFGDSHSVLRLVR